MRLPRSPRWTPPGGRHRTPFVLASIGLSLSIALSTGCHSDPCDDARRPYSAPTLIGALYHKCFPRSDRWQGATVHGLLYLDTTSMPSNNRNSPWLTLSSLPTDPNAHADRLGYTFTGSLPADIDPGIIDQTGWKVRVSDAALEYCDTCVNDCGLVPVLHLRGNVDSLVFVYDPADTVEIYLRLEEKAYSTP